ncbi:ATP-binding protein [Metabacillus schmidteae]|uniref:ATP-binding protein n=1 Tax=Metabacillus schmidteae TaxID=2730405 RepID=UPI001F22A5CB|nr:ATP-binding protein [Metabacillus schmidteae]
MKLNKYLKTSLARQFSLLTISIILAFSFLLTGLLIYQNNITNDFEQTNDRLEKKDAITSELDYSFNLAISEMRAYYAFDGGVSYFNSVIKQKENVKKKIDELEGVVDSEDDVLFIQQIQGFYSYYFEDTMPKSKEFYDNGQTSEVINIAVGQNASEIIRSYQGNIKEYTGNLDKQLSTLHDTYSKNIFISQVVFGSLLFLLICAMAIFTRKMLVSIGKPLKKLALAAGEIAEGNPILFNDSTKREDELGLLSIAFEKMTKSIQDKEQDLSAQNEELFAQQDELQAQQNELEEALKTTQKRELDLKRRNDLVNGLANTLDKQKVLKSIVETMCEVIGADKGLIVLLSRGLPHSSFGVSEEGVRQFINHLDSGLMIRLEERKVPFIIKRKCETEEQGFHTQTSYCFDIYMPVLSSSGLMEAVMVYTRLDQAFTDEELVEFNGLSKQIAISLDKIRIFELSEGERQLTQDILDTINEGIQLIDSNGIVLQVNTKMCDIIESQRETMLQNSYKNWLETLLKNADNRQELKAFFDRIVLEGKTDRKSFVFHQQSPTIKVIQVYCEPLTRDGEKFGTVVVYRDITKEYEVDVMKSEFVSTVSHELRTPLASVLGFTELMLNRELKPERQKKYLTTIYQEAKRLTVLINDFLDVQRMEAGKQTYDKKFDDIVPLISTIVETHQVNYPSHSIQYHVQTSNTMVLGDKDKISQVFTNLISNAIKYSPNGGNIVITVFEEDTKLKVSIKDEGLGIPEEAIDKLFTKFYRVDNSDRRRIGGTGLGLAIVKEIMKAHDGDVLIQSELKKGSIFTVSFPLVIGIGDHAKDKHAVTSPKGKVNVIIVEDDNSLANLLKTELEESNFHVKTFSNGETALEAIKVERPDAIVLDIMLEEKGLDGWDIIKQLKNIDELKSIPIFISSALDEKEKGLALGANEYLIKPYQPSKLSKLILQTLLKKDWSGQILIPSEENSEDQR